MSRYRTPVRQSRNVRRRPVPKNRKKPNILFIFSLFAICVTLSGGVTFALRTPKLQVAEIDIKGIGICDKAQIETIARSALGRNILVLRKSPILGKLRSVSQIEHVKMGRYLPGKVWIRVWEHRPDAVLTDGSSWWLIKDNGLVFHKTDCPPNGVPVLWVQSCEQIKIGERCADARVESALEALKCGRDEGLQLGKISVDPRGDMCLNMGSGFYVRFGQPDEIARKMALLKSALVYRPSIANEALYIDVSCPAAPVWRPKSKSHDAS